MQELVGDCNGRASSIESWLGVEIWRCQWSKKNWNLGRLGSAAALTIVDCQWRPRRRLDKLEVDHGGKSVFTLALEIVFRMLEVAFPPKGCRFLRIESVRIGRNSPMSCFDFFYIILLNPAHSRKSLTWGFCNFCHRRGLGWTREHWQVWFPTNNFTQISINISFFYDNI